MSKPVRTPSERERSAVILAYWYGTSLSMIAKGIGFGEHVVRAILYDAGGDLPNSTVPEETIRLISNLAEDGASHTEIRRTTGADYRTVFMVAPGTAWAHGGGGDASAHRKAKEAFEGLG